MKSTIIIVIALFVISDKTSQGKKLLFRKKCPLQDCGQSPNPVVADGNRTFIYLENGQNKTVETGLQSSDPAIVKKKFYCLCNLPVCVCCKYDNPETWYVKTFLKRGTRMKPAIYSIRHANDTVHDTQYPGNDIKTQRTSKKGFKYKFCPMKKEPEEPGNKWLFGCPPLINLSRKKKDVSQIYPKVFNMKCECSKCKLYTPNSKSGVLVQCGKCGDININKPNEPINFSKLLFKRNNKARIRAKFIQINFK